MASPVSGSSGVGKTRLALEGCKAFTDKHSDFETFCIFNRFQQDLAEELRVLLSEPGDYLILVDDANRISQFDYLIPYLQDQKDDKKIKIVATVRDYAVKQIMSKAQRYGSFDHLKIDPFTNEQIKGLIKTECNISNPSYVERIQDIAQGNPRLALMAGNIADQRKTLESIRDVSNLYKEYYRKIDADLETLKDSDHLKVAGIISFYRAVDKSNEEQMCTIKKVFKIDSSTFWNAAAELHSMEILNMYETEVVKISDQVLGTYLFYKAVFKDQVIRFSTLLDNFFPEHRKRFIDAFNPVISAFDDKILFEKMRPDIEKAFALAKESKDTTKLFHLREAFWFIKPVEVLANLKESIHEITAEQVDISKITFEPSELVPQPSILKILTQFKNSSLDNFRLAIQLILEYTEAKPSKIPQVIKVFADKTGFNRHSWRYGYIHQEIILNELWEKTKNGSDTLFSKLFLQIAEKYLKTKFSDTRSNDGHSITIIDFELPPSEKLFELRVEIWNRVFQLYQVTELQQDAFAIIQQYSNSGYLVSNKEIIQEDITHISKFIESELSPKNLSHCLFVQDYSNFLEQKEIKIPNFIEQFFRSDTYNIAQLLLIDRFERMNDNISQQEYENKRKEELAKYITNFGFEDFKKLFKQCHTVLKALREDHKKRQLNQSIAFMLNTLAENDKELCVEVIKYYVSLDDPFDFNALSISNILLDCCEVSEALELVKEQDNPKKEELQFGILYST